MCMKQLVEEITSAKRTAALLSHPTVKRLAKLHPDVQWNASTYSNVVYGTTHISVRSDDPWDISGLPEVQTNTVGYFLIVDAVSKKFTLRGVGDPCEAIIRVCVEQRYTEEEKELLRAVGKITRITDTTSYDALTCGQ